MKLVMFLMSLGLSAVFAQTEFCEMAAFYEELGCSPVPNPSNTTACAIAYDCPEYPDTTKCYYKGIAYSEGESLPNSVVDHPCALGCFCGNDGEDGVQFICAVVDCFIAPDRDNDTCIITRELDSCCNAGSICGEENIAKLKTCELYGRTYKEGQAIYPRNTNKLCICTDEWNGDIEDPRFCQELNCGLEIYYRKGLNDRCAALVLSSREYCPVGFICPSDTTRIVRQGVPSLLASLGNSPQCLFGNSKLHIGDRLVVDDKCIICSCVVPPYVRCIRDPNCF